MTGKLDVGGTLGEVFETYGNHAGVLLPIAFWLYLIVAVVSGLSVENFALFPLVILVGTIAATLYQGVVVGLVRDVQDGHRDFSARELIESAWPVVLPLIGVGILFGVGVAIGFILLVVPGLILLTIWAVVAPVIVVEHSGVIDAFGRSRELVRGNGWQVFGVILVAFLIAGVASFILGQIAIAIAEGPILRIVFSALASTLTAPIGALAAAVLYFRLLQLQGPAEPAPPPPAPPTAPPPPPPPPTA